MSTVLWLASWYPNKTSPFAGDFIQRQARATAMIRPISLVFVTGMAPEPADDRRIQVIEKNTADGSFRERIVYYPKPGERRGFFPRFLSLTRYLNQYRVMLRNWRKSGNLPALVHVQVAMKAGLIALYLKKRYGIPYVLTEHWTGYLAGSQDPFQHKGFLFRLFSKEIIRHASWFLPVSQNLGTEIARTIARVPTRVVPNVVDTTLFHLATGPETQRFRFIHVSSLLPQKNPEGIISAFEKLRASGLDAELVLVGPPSDPVWRLAEEKKELRGHLFLTGEISYAAVAEQMKKSSAFILFSRVENLPCVVLESLCCGLPVISTRVGGLPEVIGKENGVLIDAGNESQLETAMRNMIAGYSAYDRQAISDDARARYNYRTIGEQYAQIYTQVLQAAGEPAHSGQR